MAKHHAVFFYVLFFHVKHKKWLFLAVLTWFPILGKIQGGGQDGDHCWWRHRPAAAPPPIKHTPSCYEDQRLSTKGKIVSKFCNISKTPGRGSIHPSPPPLYHGGGMNLLVRARVNYILRHNKLRYNVINMLLLLHYFRRNTYSSAKAGKFAKVPVSRLTILLFLKSLQENELQ